MSSPYLWTYLICRLSYRLLHVGTENFDMTPFFFLVLKRTFDFTYIKAVYETHMGRVQDIVTGLLNGSSSMIPLFFKSRGVGFAAGNRKKSLNTLNNGDIFMNNCKIKQTKNVYCRILRTFLSKTHVSCWVSGCG